jgi:hypothetical protein
MRNRAEYPPIKNKAINAIPPKNIIKIALATKQEGTAGGIDAAISWGVGILAGIAATVLATTPIGVAVVVNFC